MAKYNFDKPRVAIYIRVSTNYQVDKDSLPMQRKDLIAYSQLILNTNDYVIFEDAGYSAKNTDRPEYQRMMQQIRQGMFSHLLVWKLDRISRNLLDFAQMYEELKSLGVTFVSKNEQFDTSTAMGEAMLKIILVFAELERKITSERVTATMISRAGDGLWNGGRVPYGYSYDKETSIFSINEAEADLVRKIHDIYEKEQSLVKTSSLINDTGILTRSGKLWSPHTLAIIINSVWYCGDYRYNVNKEGNRQRPKEEAEWVTVTDHHPAIISREQKERVLYLMKTNVRGTRQRVSKSKKHIHVFGGLMVCANCNKVMTNSNNNSDRKRPYSYYICRTNWKSKFMCNAKMGYDPTIGEFVINYILNMINAQKRGVSSVEELNSALLTGSTFSDILTVGENGLNATYEIIKSGIKGPIYGNTVPKPKKQSNDNELTILLKEKEKVSRAIERLNNLYLFDDNAMSESDYIIKRNELDEKLDKILESIGMQSKTEDEVIISNDDFVERASEFIIAKNLEGRNYISYRRLSDQVDKTVLKSFFSSIIYSIYLDKGRISKIIFRNGITHEFIYKDNTQ